MASAQATAYLARTVGGNEGGNAAAITALIDGLVADGVWAKLDALYVLAQQNATDAKLNLVGANYPLAPTGSPLFASYSGFGSFTTSNYFDTGFNAATAPSPQFTQNSASFGFWTLSTVTESVPEMGNTSRGVTGESHIYNHFTDGNFYVRINNSVASGAASPGTAGLYVGDRPSSIAVVPYWNGAAQTSQASASEAPYSGNFTVGSVSSSPASNTAETLRAAFIGASLGAVGQLALFNRLQTYINSVPPAVVALAQARALVLA